MLTDHKAAADTRDYSDAPSAHGTHLGLLDLPLESHARLLQCRTLGTPLIQLD